jgi:predicted TIM-barrel enzyme
MSIEVYPVIHIKDTQQAVDQAGVAFEAGAAGVYLIDHESGGQPDKLVSAFNEVVWSWPDSFVGVNLLQPRSGYNVFSFILSHIQDGSLARLPNGVWVDDADREHAKLTELRHEVAELDYISYLGGVAFKYSAGYTDQPDKAAQLAAQMAPEVDVVTTSGPGTGVPPSPDKIHAMKQAIGDKKLAVASGIDSQNIANYRGSIDQLLVATSIETEPYSGIFIPAEVVRLIDAANSV